MHLVVAPEPPANIFHRLALSKKQSYEIKHRDGGGGGGVFPRQRSV